MFSNELQNILIIEFSRRFKEEYCRENSSPDRKLITNSSNKQLWNINNNNNTNNSNSKQYSFTGDLISKLISKYIIFNLFY